MNSLRQDGSFCQYPDEEKERKIHEAALLKSIGKVEKARDFSKLYPKTIIDKRGRRTTVYVSRNETAETTDANKGRTAILREKLKANLRPYSGLFIKNKHSPVRAYISGNCANKIGSNKAIEKSKANGFTVEQHFEIANRIVPLFRKSYLKETKSDKDSNPNIKSVKRFAANTRLSDGTKTKVWITVLEAKVEGHRIYSVELMEIEEAPSAKEDASGGTVGKSNATAESRKSKQKGNSDFRPVTASTNLYQANGAVNKKPKATLIN